MFFPLQVNVSSAAVQEWLDSMADLSEAAKTSLNLEVSVALATASKCGQGSLYHTSCLAGQPEIEAIQLE